VPAHFASGLAGRSDAEPVGEAASRGRGISERRRGNICDHVPPPQQNPQTYTIGEWRESNAWHV